MAKPGIVKKKHLHMNIGQLYDKNCAQMVACSLSTQATSISLDADYEGNFLVVCGDDHRATGETFDCIPVHRYADARFIAGPHFSILNEGYVVE